MWETIINFDIILYSQFQLWRNSIFYSPLPLEDRFIKRCKAITERVAEEVQEVEGEWLSLSDMENLNFSELLSLIHFGSASFWTQPILAICG